MLELLVQGRLGLCVCVSEFRASRLHLEGFELFNKRNEPGLHVSTYRDQSFSSSVP